MQLQLIFWSSYVCVCECGQLWIMRPHDSKISEWKTLRLGNEFTYRSQLRSNCYIKPLALYRTHTNKHTHTHMYSYIHIYLPIQSDTKKNMFICTRCLMPSWLSPQLTKRELLTAAQRILNTLSLEKTITA